MLARLDWNVVGSVAVIALAVAAVPAAAHAQTGEPTWSSAEDVAALPADLRSAPIQTEDYETVVGPDGVETIVRTRRIYGQAPVQGYQQYPVLERDEWIEECRERTRGYDRADRGRIIGGLLGAVAGGIIGNRIAGSGDRLAGTLLGAGVGAAGGAIVGDSIDDRNDRDRDDCETALNGYLANRIYPAPGYSAYPAAYGSTYPRACGCALPEPQMTYVPVRYEQQQRVVVRENVRDEYYSVPARERLIENPRPVPSAKMIKR